MRIFIVFLKKALPLSTRTNTIIQDGEIYGVFNDGNWNRLVGLYMLW